MTVFSRYAAWLVTRVRDEQRLVEAIKAAHDERGDVIQALLEIAKAQDQIARLDFLLAPANESADAWTQHDVM